jgi:hypothetical protein
VRYVKAGKWVLYNYLWRRLQTLSDFYWVDDDSEDILLALAYKAAFKSIPPNGGEVSKPTDASFKIRCVVPVPDRNPTQPKSKSTKHPSL